MFRNERGIGVALRFVDDLRRGVLDRLHDELFGVGLELRKG